jgi:hypothetical protein
MAIVEYVNQREDEDGQENWRQSKVEQENSSDQEEDQQANEPVIFRGVEFLERDPRLRRKSGSTRKIREMMCKEPT